MLKLLRMIMLLSLTMSFSIAHATDFPQIEKINKDEKAVFSGYLINNDYFRFYEDKVSESEVLNKRLEELQNVSCETSPIKFETFALVGIGGVLVGLLAGIMVSK